MPLVKVLGFGLALVMMLPQIALWLPQYYYGR